MRYAVEEIKQELLDEEQCWHAVLARDAQVDGTFVFAVRSTGVYCRPSCPARRPHRENVAFFRLAEEASAAGFRACRRCHPEQSHLSEPQAELIEQVCRYIETHLDAPLTSRRSEPAVSPESVPSPTHVQADQGRHATPICRVLPPGTIQGSTTRRGDGDGRAL